MEKRAPHCKLSVVKAMIEGGKARITLSALTDGAALGFDADGIIGVVMTLTTKDFHKSMTTGVDHPLGHLRSSSRLAM